MEGGGRDWNAWKVLEVTRGFGKCWQGQEDMESIGRDWRTQVALARTCGQERVSLGRTKGNIKLAGTGGHS